MKKNMVVLSIVAVLGVSQVAGMNKRGSENQASALADLNKNIDKLAQGMKMAVKLMEPKKDPQTGLKNVKSPIFTMKKPANKVAVASAKNQTNKVAVASAKNQTSSGAMVTELKKIIETKKTTNSGFFSRMYNKAVQNKVKIAAVVAGAAIVGGLLYYYLSNPTQAIEAIAQPMTPIAEAMKEAVRPVTDKIQNGLIESTKSYVLDSTKIGFEVTGPNPRLDWVCRTSGNFWNSFKGYTVHNYGTDGLNCNVYKVLENGKEVIKYAGKCFNLQVLPSVN